MQVSKKIRKIVIIIFICMAIFVLFETKTKAYTREDVENAIVKVAKEMVEIGGKKYNIDGYNNSGYRYTILSWKLRDGHYQSATHSSNTREKALWSDCGSFCAGVYKIVFGDYKDDTRYLNDSFPETSPIRIRRDEDNKHAGIEGAFSTRNIEGMDKRGFTKKSELRPGDVLSTGKSIHAAIYLGDGKIAQQSGNHNWNISGLSSNLKYYYRISDTALESLTYLNTVIPWSDIGIDEISEPLPLSEDPLIEPQQPTVTHFTREQAETALIKVAKEIIDVGNKNNLLLYRTSGQG